MLVLRESNDISFDSWAAHISVSGIYEFWSIYDADVADVCVFLSNNLCNKLDHNQNKNSSLARNSTCHMV